MYIACLGLYLSNIEEQTTACGRLPPSPKQAVLLEIHLPRPRACNLLRTPLSLSLCSGFEPAMHLMMRWPIANPATDVFLPTLRE